MLGNIYLIRFVVLVTILLGMMYIISPFIIDCSKWFIGLGICLIAMATLAYIGTKQKN